MKHAYVYYRMDPAKADLAASSIDLLLSAMAGYCNQLPRRLNRCDDPHMWMEVYEGIASVAAFSIALNEAARTFDCAAFTQGDRHLECFSTPQVLPNRQEE